MEMLRSNQSQALPHLWSWMDHGSEELAETDSPYQGGIFHHKERRGLVFRSLPAQLKWDLEATAVRPVAPTLHIPQGASAVPLGDFLPT